MFSLFKHFSPFTRRTTVAIALAAAFIGCTQTPTTDPSTARVNNVITSGLTGEYFDNIDFTGTKQTRVDTTIDSTWGTGAPIVGIASDSYSVRWTGQIQPAFTEEYTFSLTSSGQARLMINGVVLVDNWTEHASQADTGKVSLQANTKYDIRLEYARDTMQPAQAKLEWQSTRQAKQVVPNPALFSSGSNVEKALIALQENSKFKALDFRSDPDMVTAYLEGDSITLLAPNRLSGQFLTAYIKGGVVEYYFVVSNRNGFAYFQDSVREGETQILRTKDIDMQNLNDLQYQELMQGYAKALSGKSMSVIEVSSAVARTQGTYDPLLECVKKMKPPLDCEGFCATDADNFKKAVCEQSNTFITLSIGLVFPIIDEVAKGEAAPAVLKKWWKKVSDSVKAFGVAVAGVWGSKKVLDGQKAIESAYQNLLRCLERHVLQGCKPIMSPVPNDVVIKKKLNEYGQETIPFIGNARISKTGLDYAFTTENESTNMLYIIPGVWGNYLAPGAGESIDAVYSCPNKPVTVKSKVTITRNLSENVPSPKSITVTLICENLPKLIANPLSLVAQVSTSTTGDMTLENQGDADLEIKTITGVTTTQGLAGAKLEIVSNPAPVTLAPGSSAKLGIKGTCGSTVGVLSGTVTISSNDPLSPEKQVGVTLECINARYLGSTVIAGLTGSGSSCYDSYAHRQSPLYMKAYFGGFYGATIDRSFAKNPPISGYNVSIIIRDFGYKPTGGVVESCVNTTYYGEFPKLRSIIESLKSASIDTWLANARPNLVLKNVRYMRSGGYIADVFETK
jgi:PA14 domain